MVKFARLFIAGQSQVVQLPEEFRFEGTEVDIRRDDLTGEVILRTRRHDWADFYALADRTEIPTNFLGVKDRL